MIAISPPLRRIVQLFAVATALTLPQAALTQCAGIHEEGRWRNLDNGGEPSYIDVKMVGGCGDQVLNGQQTGSSTRYSMRVWVKQSTGLAKTKSMPSARGRRNLAWPSAILAPFWREPRE
jgi:hypothetical protein